MEDDLNFFYRKATSIFFEIGRQHITKKSNQKSMKSKNNNIFGNGGNLNFLVKMEDDLEKK
jgi:hypothetical protein